MAAKRSKAPRLPQHEQLRRYPRTSRSRGCAELAPSDVLRVRASPTARRAISDFRPIERSLQRSRSPTGCGCILFRSRSTSETSFARLKSFLQRRQRLLLRSRRARDPGVLSVTSTAVVERPRRCRARRSRLMTCSRLRRRHSAVRPVRVLLRGRALERIPPPRSRPVPLRLPTSPESATSTESSAVFATVRPSVACSRLATGLPPRRAPAGAAESDRGETQNGDGRSEKPVIRPVDREARQINSRSHFRSGTRCTRNGWVERGARTASRP